MSGSTDGYTVEPESLHDYATRLASLLDRFTALAEASQSVTQTDGAFGAMNAWIEPLIDAKHELVHPIIGEAADALGTHIDALRECAAAYESADADVAEALEALEGELS